MAHKKLILFVCTGNICRSPMAEGLFREMTKNGDEFEVQSAGVGAGYGQRASEHSVTALRELKINISDHRSQPLTEKLAREAEFIFVMTRSHFEAIVYHFPDAAEKTYLLREFEESKSRAPLEIPDPIGMGYDAYLQCREAIRKALTSVHRFLTTPSATSTMTPTPTPTTPSILQKTLSLAIGADHGGLELKTSIEKALRHAGMKVTDFGTNSPASVDYPDFAQPVCQQVISGDADFGILICTTGIGMSIAANRHPHIRAALVSNPETAAITRQHNDANVLCLGASGLDSATALKIVETFLSTGFSGGRHEQRVEKLDHLGSATPSLTAVEEADPAIFAAIMAEEKRQSENIELIASENFTSRAVMEVQGSCLTNKYAEGYPGRRWYGGCENVDIVEQLAIDRAKELFGAKFANVQPHSGSQANAAVYFSVLQPGDKVLGMNLAHGGHLTHGNPANFSGRFYQFSQYGVSPRDERIDYDELAEVAQRERPKMITAGASAYPRIIDFQKMSEIAKSVGAYLFVDMAHIAGLVAAGVHPSPMEFADFVTTTTHKSLRGPRGGMVLTNNEEFAKKINSQVFPGVQGGPLMHVIAAKAVCFLEALQPSFRDYQQQVVQNAKALAGALAHKGYRIVSGGTENHLMLVDLRPNGLNGKVASDTLDHAGITVNKNGIPFDTEKITLGGGIRIGTPAATTRGMKEEEMMEIADLIDQALRNVGNDAALAAIKQQVIALTARFPLPR